MSLAGLSFSGPAAAHDETAPATQWDFIAFEVKSWGEPVTSWRVTGLGGGSWTETRKERFEPLGTYTLVWHEIGDNPQRAASLAAILARLPDEAPDPANCVNRMSDLPYGTIRLTRGATTIEIAWNSGCMDESYQAFMAVLKEADALVAAAGRAAPVLREERFAGGQTSN